MNPIDEIAKEEYTNNETVVPENGIKGFDSTYEEYTACETPILVTYTLFDGDLDGEPFYPTLGVYVVNNHNDCNVLYNIKERRYRNNAEMFQDLLHHVEYETRRGNSVLIQ